MAKIQKVEWADFYGKKAVEVETPKDFMKVAKKYLPAAVTVCAGVTFALHSDFTAFAAEQPEAVAVFAQAGAADFSEQLRKATKPIRDIMMSFGHEIYGVMMLWGGIEALIGKFPQGIQRMKASTVAYILLVWVPWIVDTVSTAIPH